MTAWLLPLADGDVGLFKLAIIIIVLIVWGIRAMAKTMSKPPQGRMVRPPIGARRPAPPPLPARPRPAPLPPVPAAGRVVSPAVRAVAASAAKSVDVDRAASTRRPRAAATRLLAARTLRDQFILAEAMQPPLALRATRRF